jgi:predicted RNase H-like nuclease (RuvC/YqgF family)
MKEIDRSRPVTEKWATKKGFKPTTKVINGKEIKAYELSFQELQELQHELNNEITIEAGYIPHYEPAESVIKEPENSASIIEKMISYNEKYLDRIESYIQRTAIAEAQQKLIETSEARKDNEINRLRAELKTALSRTEVLKSEIEALKKELAESNKKTFFGIKLK